MQRAGREGVSEQLGLAAGMSGGGGREGKLASFELLTDSRAAEQESRG